MKSDFQKSLQHFDSARESLSHPIIDIEFPINQADSLIKKEAYNKHLYRPNTYLHKWWARRSGVTFRCILKQLVEDPSKTNYYSAGGLENKIIFDPMMGGGTTLHEAIRLGANVIGVDIEPIPVLQAKATLTQIELSKINELFDEYFTFLTESIGDLFKTSCPICQDSCDIQYTLYGLKKACDCSEYIVIDNYVLQERKGNNLTICPDCHDVLTEPSHVCKSDKKIRLLEKTVKNCPKCGKPLKEFTNLPYTDRYVPLVICGNCSEHGQFFKPFSDTDKKNIVKAKNSVKKGLPFNRDLLKISPGTKSSDLINRKIGYYDEVFTPRQLLYIKYSIEYLQKIQDGAERIPLALLISTSLEFNSLLCGYKGAGILRPGAIRHVFSYHAYTFPYTALENNPVYPQLSSGSLKRIFNDRLVKSIKWSYEPIEREITDSKIREVKIPGEIDRGVQVFDIKKLITGSRKFYLKQTDASSFSVPNNFVDFVVTDPPYFDSVQYSELSEFFRVWLEHFIPNDADWNYSSHNSAVSNKMKEKGRYSDLLTDIWTNCKNCLKADRGRLVFTFHHWRSQAWAELIISLNRAGFELINFYVVESENPTSVHISGINSLKHDAILVCAPKNWTIKKSLWKRPLPIKTSDSYEFIQSCGEMTGWILENEITENEILKICSEIIGVNGNGASTC